MANFLDCIFCHCGAHHCETPQPDWHLRLTGLTVLLTGKTKPSETDPRHQQNCTDCHKENARPVRSEPQESHAAPWRLQGVARRPGGIPAAKTSSRNRGARHL